MTRRDNMSRGLFMGIDIGTSGVRAAVFDEEGNQISLAYREYSMISTKEGMGELNSETIFQSFIEVAKESIEDESRSLIKVEAIGLSSQMHSIMAVDKEGNNLTNLLTWADTRSIGAASYIEENYDYKRLYDKTGCRIQHPIYPLSKILWMKKENPTMLKQVYKFMTIKEYIVFKLFGEFLIDITDASTTGCFNIHQFTWEEEIFKDILQIGEDKFGQPVDCTYILKNMKHQYARAMKIHPETPVAIGSADGIMANIGCGTLHKSAMASTVGTTGALRITVDKPLLDSKQRTWCYCLTRDMWVAGGAVNNGGIVLKWIRDQYSEQFQYEAKNLGESDIYKLFTRYASEIEAGSNGLFFLPYLTGERSPGWNPNARGMIYGLQLMHNKKHMIRAAMEGVMYNMYSVYELLAGLNGDVDRLVANGGYIHSPTWLQMQANIFGKEIAVAGVGEASALGAAYVAMVAIGAVKEFKQALPNMKPVKIIKPNYQEVELYKDYYKEFKSLYSRFITKI